MSKRYAIVSIGTNSTRALLADVGPDHPRVENARSIGTRVGEGLKEGGTLSDEAMQRTLDAVTSALSRDPRALRADLCGSDERLAAGEERRRVFQSRASDTGRPDARPPAKKKRRRLIAVR